jgi:hypothetical protein
VDRPTEMTTQLYHGIEVKAKTRNCFQKTVVIQASAAGCGSVSNRVLEHPFDLEADCFVS